MPTAVPGTEENGAHTDFSLGSPRKAEEERWHGTEDALHPEHRAGEALPLGSRPRDDLIS